MTAALRSTLRWVHQANIERYGRILRTNLTDDERRFVQRRLAEEREALKQMAEENRLHGVDNRP